MKVKWHKLLITCAVVLVLGIAGFRVISHLTKTDAKDTVDEQTLVIRVERVTKGEVIDQVKISGTIKPLNEVEIFPKIQGRVIALHRDVGDLVRSGDVLAVIEHQEIALQEKSAKASLAMAKTNELAAKNEFDRANELFADRAMAKAELETIEQKYDLAKAQVLASQAQADIARQQLKNANITSLIDGTITKRTAAIGTSVSPQMAIFTVQDISKLKLVTSVDASTLMRLKKGSIAHFNIEQLKLDLPGKIITLAPSLDAQSRRAEVEIEIDDTNEKLVPNMFIDGALILSKTESVLIVPNKALVGNAKTPAVFRVIDGQIQLVTPKLGQRDNYYSEIIDGLKENDAIAVSGLDRLQDGSLVTIEETAK